MDESFDPYAEWLGIPAAEQPPHYYRLLGLPIFSSDATQIRAEADRRMLYVRTFQLGKRSQASQNILNELAAARVCLLSPASKSRYDAALSEWLAARLPGPPPVPPEAPPLPAAGVRLLPPEEFPAAVGAGAPSEAAAAPTPAKAQGRRVYTGWLIIAGIIVATLIALGLIRFGQRRGAGALQDAANRPPAATLPGSDKTPDANLGGQYVSVPSEVVLQTDTGDVSLHLARAKISGPTLKLAGETTADWQSTDDQIEWQMLIHKPGIFRVIVTYAADAKCAGGQAQVNISGRAQPLRFAIRDTGGSDKFVSDSVQPMVMLDKAGRYTLSIQAARQPGPLLMTLRDVQLHRAPVR